MIHFTKEGGRKKVGLNLYRTRGGFVVAWVWYYPETHELKGWRFRLRMHMKPRILWSVDSCNVIANYLTIHDLQFVNREVLSVEKILHLVDTHVGAPSMSYPLDNSDWINFARAIEATHGIKE